MAAAVAEAAAALQRRVRILEVGAGTGRATQAVLAALAPLAGRFDYVCTDRSPALLEAARTRLAATADGVRFERLDLAAPVQPNDALGAFDIVIAANAVHALADIAEGLRHLKARLGRDGVLVLDEPTRPRDALTLTLGLLSDWWRTDPARTAPGALLSAPRWEEVLREEFPAVDVSGGEERSVIVARTTAAASSSPAGPQPDLLPVVLHAVAEAIDADPAGIDREARLPISASISLAAGDVARLLSIALDRPVAAHAIDDHATPIRLARYLGSQATTSAVAAPPAPVPSPTGALEAMVVEVIAAVTETDAASIDPACASSSSASRSILAGDAAQLLSKRLGRTISPAVFNEHPTVAALARYIGDAPDRRAAPAAPAASPAINRPTSPGGQHSGGLKHPGEQKGDGPVPTTQVWELAERGDLSSLSAHDSVRRAPGAGEVEVEVIAAGLNFRDVMEALGRIGDEARPLGLEFAGRVTAVGPGVAGLSPGDEVVGLRIGCLARHVVTRASLVAPKPAHLSFAEAAGLPIVFLTAAATLERIAKLGPGKTVLVHAASGGVGLAALQIARAAGATVLATAGSPEKRAHLQALGVECVADLRNVSFADAVRRATGGAGVDVVLNCLAGAMTDAGLALVRPGGIFIEIGKTDIRPADEIARRYPDIGYIGLRPAGRDRPAARSGRRGTRRADESVRSRRADRAAGALLPVRGVRDGAALPRAGAPHRQGRGRPRSGRADHFPLVVSTRAGSSPRSGARSAERRDLVSTCSGVSWREGLSARPFGPRSRRRKGPSRDCPSRRRESS